MDEEKDSQEFEKEGSYVYTAWERVSTQQLQRHLSSHTLKTGSHSKFLVLVQDIQMCSTTDLSHTPLNTYCAMNSIFCQDFLLFDCILCWKQDKCVLDTYPDFQYVDEYKDW